MKSYDLIVIGGGAGGLTAAAGAASMGANVALIEKEEQPGGDCLHYGCIPSKALIESAKMVYTAKKAAEEFGFFINGKADLSVAKKRVMSAIAEIQKHDDADRFREMGVDVYHGYGRFKDAHHVQIDSGKERKGTEEVIRGKRIVIATGSSPRIPPIEGIETVTYLTNETIFELDEAPNRLVVIGAGPIGLELAQSLARFGSKVTVIEFASDIFVKEDPELVPYVKKALEKEISFKFNMRVEKVEENSAGEKVVTIDSIEGTETIVSDAILIAAGRKPNIDNLGLELIVVNVERGNIVVSETLQTSVPHIYAVGDVTGAFPFTHAAGLEGKTVIANAVFGLKKKVNYDHVPWVTYTDPEVFHLGLTETEAKEKFGNRIQVYRVTSDDVDRFVADRELNGFLKVVTDKNGKILGAHAVGKGAGDWMQEIVLAKQKGIKIGDISNVIHPYPTHGAILQRAADQYWRKKLFQGWIPKLSKKYIQWFR